MCLYLVMDATPGEDCARLNSASIAYDTSCSNVFVTICQRAADIGKHDIK